MPESSGAGSAACAPPPTRCTAPGIAAVDATPATLRRKSLRLIAMRSSNGNCGTELGFGARFWLDVRNRDSGHERDVKSAQTHSIPVSQLAVRTAGFCLTMGKGKLVFQCPSPLFKLCPDETAHFDRRRLRNYAS